ncbi:hypothetical protein Cfor_06103 [Coptotermes formosanus]|uniref:Uncharacterized protein n=1 Tax=Coptotermes formosanus TaxID=36987 RepID=A0A6L2PW05_COPFO|nr:hypothetical protein Cfor_06103 [Coptotermes formosanus]
MAAMTQLTPITVEYAYVTGIVAVAVNAACVTPVVLVDEVSVLSVGQGPAHCSHNSYTRATYFCPSPAADYITPCSRTDPNFNECALKQGREVIPKIVKVNVTAKYKTFCNLTQKSDGKTYVEPYDYELVLEPKKGVIHFGNLFNGNKLLADYIKPCSRNDPKFNECALKSGTAAIPRVVKGDRTLGVPVLDPLFVEKVSMTHSGLHATSKNFTITGMKDAVLEDFSAPNHAPGSSHRRRTNVSRLQLPEVAKTRHALTLAFCVRSADFDKQIFKLSFKTPRVELIGEYDVRGKLLGLPLSGQGDYQLTFSLKEYHIPVLDPLYVAEVRALDTGLDMAAKNVTVEGMRNIVLQNIRIDLQKKEVTVEVVVPEAHFTGNYEVKGKLLALPIVGKGSFDAVFYDLYVKYVTTFYLKKLEDGEDYLTPDKYKVDFEPRHLKARLDNLFNGNKLLVSRKEAPVNNTVLLGYKSSTQNSSLALRLLWVQPGVGGVVLVLNTTKGNELCLSVSGDNMNKFLNENWRDVLKDTGDSASDTGSLAFTVRSVEHCGYSGEFQRLRKHTATPLSSHSPTALRLPTLSS